jgi:hypothetical protein
MTKLKPRWRQRWAKFWWQDWTLELGFKRCSRAARGLWMDMLAAAALADPPGYMPLPDDELWKLSPGPPEEVPDLLTELENANIFSRDKRGRIYSRRLIRDRELTRLGIETGKMGGNPSLRRTTTKSATLNPPLNPIPYPPRSKKLEAEARVTTPSDVAIETAQADGVVTAPPPNPLLKEGASAESEPVAATASGAALADGSAPAAVTIPRRSNSAKRKTDELEIERNRQANRLFEQRHLAEMAAARAIRKETAAETEARRKTKTEAAKAEQQKRDEQAAKQRREAEEARERALAPQRRIQRLQGEVFARYGLEKGLDLLTRLDAGDPETELIAQQIEADLGITPRKAS